MGEVGAERWVRVMDANAKSNFGYTERGAGRDEIPDGFVLVEPNSPFRKTFGPLYERIEGASFVRAFRVDEHHKNINSVAHGGALASFADMLLARALRWELDRYGVTVRLVTDYLGPAKFGDWVEGRSWITGGGNTVAFVTGQGHVGDRPVFSATAIFRMKRQR
jgi:acyl-coenzyme A thioesterase PaaI-like protein